LSQLALADPPVPPGFPKKVLFWGEEAGKISSYVAGWMAGKGIDVILLDGANRFDPYMASSFARRALIPPERLLRKIRIARAFTCYQMATLMGERLVSLLHARTVGAIHESLLQKPWVIVLGPITTFLDEDVPEREVRPLFERSLKRVEEMAMAEIPFFLFQPPIFSKNTPPFTKGRAGRLIDSKKAYLMRRLFQFANLAWRITLDDQGPKLILEKGLIEKYSNNKHQIPMDKILNSKQNRLGHLDIGA
jgi:hypothetical protein